MYKSGDLINLRGYVSTSLNINEALNFAFSEKFPSKKSVLFIFDLNK